MKQLTIKEEKTLRLLNKAKSIILANSNVKRLTEEETLKVILKYYIGGMKK